MFIHLFVKQNLWIGVSSVLQWSPRDSLPAPISSAIYSCDGLLVYAGFCDGAVGVFDAESLRLRCRISPAAYLTSSIARLVSDFDLWLIPLSSFSTRTEHLSNSFWMFWCLHCSGSVYPTVIAAHPAEPNQFALGMSDGAVHVVEPSDAEPKWGSLPPPQENGTLPSISNPALSNQTSEPPARWQGWPSFYIQIIIETSCKPCNSSGQMAD